MKPKPSFVLIAGLAMLLLFLNACTPATTSPKTATLVPTLALAEPTAAQPQPTTMPAVTTEAPAPPTRPAALPASAEETYAPLDKETCTALQQALSSQFGLPIAIQEAPFSDSLAGTGGTACSLQMTATGLDLPGGFPVLLTALDTFRNNGWYEDPSYAASGPMGESVLFRRSAEKIAMVLLGMEFGPNAPCPTDQPVGACTAEPQDIIYTLMVDAAQRQLPYRPEDQALCARMQQELNALLPAAWAVDEAALEDFDLPAGSRGCRISFSASEESLQSDFSTIDSKVNGYFADTGWQVDNTLAAGGPTAVIQGLRKPGQLALLYLQWEPSADANCPKDQPIGVCELTPAQRLVTVTIYLAR